MVLVVFVIAHHKPVRFLFSVVENRAFVANGVVHLDLRIKDNKTIGCKSHNFMKWRFKTMPNEKQRNIYPCSAQDGKYYRSVTLANDYRLRLPLEIVDELGLGEVATLALWMNDKGQLVIEPTD